MSGIRGLLAVCAMLVGACSCVPLRWRPRRAAVVRLPGGRVASFVVVRVVAAVA